jgi:hypothetical protein
MAFNCSTLLSDIDINCSKITAGGIKKAILTLQNNITITFDGSDETIVDSVDFVDYSANKIVDFVHNVKDGTTSFSESKNTTNGLGVITTNITIQTPAVDNKINKIDNMSRREDIVCILLHNNDTVTISGWMDGLTMNYDAASGTGISDKSYVNVTLTTESGIASLGVDDYVNTFIDPTIFD